MERLDSQTTPEGLSVACEHFIKGMSGKKVRSMAEHLKKSASELWPEFRQTLMQEIATGNRQDLEIEFPEYANCNPNREQDERASCFVNR